MSSDAMMDMSNFGGHDVTFHSSALVSLLSEVKM